MGIPGWGNRAAIEGHDLIDKLETAVYRAAKAKALIEDPLLVETLTKLEDSYVSAWKLTPARDTDARERFWHGVQAVGKLRDHMGLIIQDGKLAQAEINAMAEKAA